MAPMQAGQVHRISKTDILVMGDPVAVFGRAGRPAISKPELLLSQVGGERAFGPLTKGEGSGVKFPAAQVAHDTRQYVEAFGVGKTEAPEAAVRTFGKAMLPPDAIRAAPAQTAAPGMTKATFATTLPSLTDFVTPIMKAVTAAIPLIFSLLALRIMWDAVKPKQPKFA